MALTLLSAKDFSFTLKVTIQRTGKLGFSAPTAEALGIDSNTYAKFYMDDESPQSPVVVFTKNKDEDSFKANKSGDYYSLSTSILFESLAFDFKKQSIICDLKREEEADAIVGGEAYRLVSRSPKNRRKATEVTKKLLQQMGSTFFQWAESYFNESSGHLNTKIKRKDMYNAYHAMFPDYKLRVTSNNFKTKLELYCRMKKFDLNASKPNANGLSFFDFITYNKEDIFVGGMDKSNGLEYFTVSNRESSENVIK